MVYKEFHINDDVAASSTMIDSRKSKKRKMMMTITSLAL